MVDQAVKKKLLGQYLTGIRLARLLASLAESDTAKSIIDPMAGNGDMLMACLETGNTEQMLCGIEIDPEMITLASNRFANGKDSLARVFLGSAFDPDIITNLPLRAYDLVITNPPYVRYQSLSKSTDIGVYLPRSSEIRSGLLNLTNAFPHLDGEDKSLLQKLISNYSGLSDLAVPAWILCAMLTKPGGKLAMVVPEAWLSRDYAQIIQYLLLRWFKINYVVEDVHAEWFSHALIKTTLVVAERIQRRDTAFGWADEGYLHLQIFRDASTEQSLVGNMFQDNNKPERAFALDARRLLIEASHQNNQYYSSEWVSLQNQSENLRRSVIGQGWVESVEKTAHSTIGEVRAVDTNQVVIPPRLSRWLGGVDNLAFATMSKLGLAVSQGLRTGANQFFYVDVIDETEGVIKARPHPIFGIASIDVPIKWVLPVLRKQSEIKDCFRLDTSRLNGRVLALQDAVLPEDLPQYLLKDDFGGEKQLRYEIIGGNLADYIRLVAKTNVGSAESQRFIPNLSAVKTNVRKPSMNSSDLLPRFWYMLPPFTRRHQPDLFVARVNAQHPRTFLNSQDLPLIDANFSTLWLESNDTLDLYSALAVMNSSWCVTAIELTASVMGGGALKLEATHLRRLPIPNLDPNAWARLSKLGKYLAEDQETAETIKQIDTIIIGTLLGEKVLQEKYTELMQIIEAQRSARTRKR